MNDLDQYDADPLPADGPAPEPARSPALSGLTAWVASGALHATALMLMATIVYMAKDEPIDTPPVRVTMIPDPPPHRPEPKDHKFALTAPEVKLDLATTSDVAAPVPMLQPDVPEKAESEADTPNEMPKGREEAVAQSELGGQAAFMAMGAGSAGAGMFGNRHGGGRKRAATTGGGSAGSERAVEGALMWFKRHQSADGHWDAERYFANCTDSEKCEPGSLMNYGANQVNTALTGYALLCFLGAGYDHRSGPYVKNVRKGLDWLIWSQKPDGCFGERNYEHAIATMALAEAYGMTNDPDLRAPAQRGIDLILQRQNQDKAGGGGLGWDYLNPSGRNDASVTGWNVMALKSAMGAGLSIKDGLNSSKRWLEQAWKANNDGQGGRADWRKIDGYHDETAFSYTWPSGATSFEDKGFGHRNMAAVGLACAVFLGHHAGDPMMETMANWVMNHQTPKAWPCNTYYMYYNTLSMFQVNGEKWKTWNSVVRDMLVDAQRTDEGCMRGSWDWKGTQFHGSEIGRVLSTAYCTLSLEVYYRFALAHGEKLKGL